MHIDTNILITYGGTARKVKKGEYIFHENAISYYYYQLISGEVKVVSTNIEGKELIHGIFKSGQSFGEPPLLLGKVYPCTAQAIVDCVILRIRKEFFINLLHEYPDLLEKLIFTFAKRLYSKAMSLQIWVQQRPEEKILQFLNNNKAMILDCQNQALPFTRQQIADFTGLRVETVIRTLSQMNKSGKVKIINHKLYYPN